MRDQRTAEILDQDVRHHLAMVLTGVQCGDDPDVAELARMETHRLVGAILAGLRGHRLDSSGGCTVCCGQSCVLRTEMSHSLLPIRSSPTAARALPASPARAALGPRHALAD